MAVTASGYLNVTGHASANTKGAYTQFHASTVEEAMAVVFAQMWPSGQDRATTFDIATGAAASEVVRVPDIPTTNTADWSINGQGGVVIPLGIPASTRIACRMQCTAAGSPTNGVSIYYVGGSNASNTTATGYGTITSSQPAAIDPGATPNTWSAYQQITASTTAAFNWAMTFVTTGLNTSIDAATLWGMTLATGAAASEVIRVSDLAFAGNVFEEIWPQKHAFPLSVASGVRIAVRAACNRNDATDRLFRLRLITTNVPATGYVFNALADATLTSNSSGSYTGVPLTASGSNNTKGSYAAIITSTPEAMAGIQVNCGWAWDDNSYMFDVATGAAASEVVRIANVYLRTVSPDASLPCFPIPIGIPISTRVAGRIQANSGTGPPQVTVGIHAAGGTNTSVTAVTYGSTTASTSIVSVDSGAVLNTKASYAQITASTSEDMNWLIARFYSKGNGSTNATFNVDVATGAAASEVVKLPDLRVTLNGGGSMFFGAVDWPLPYTITSGTRIAARCSSDTTDSVDRIIGAQIVAINSAMASLSTFNALRISP